MKMAYIRSTYRHENMRGWKVKVVETDDMGMSKIQCFGFNGWVKTSELERTD